jgi:D-alanyl-D-alanine carboxypeptidase/D-alanyl-D-alanine-endopeptidase (penicillin-binding protein 4)
VRRLVSALVIACVLLVSAPAHARPYWKRQIDRIVAGKDIGVALHDEGRVLYRHDARYKRVPASNEKLLMSMALFEALPPATTINTRAFTTARPVAGIVTGDLWVTGRGDPSLTAGGRFGDALPFPATRLGALANAIADSVTRIEGRVLGNTGYFNHDWFAPGWKPNFPADEVALPSALSFEGNVDAGKHIKNPEWRVARSLTNKLEDLGVQITGGPRAGRMPKDVTLLATIESRPLNTFVRFMNRQSSNFFAEVLGKRLGVEYAGGPGTIAKGASAIEAFARALGVTLSAYDASGLSYTNRVAPVGIVKLLTHVEETTTYYEQLRDGLPSGGEGTLEDRLHDVRLRAKTGSLSGISALSGWVWLDRTSSWAEFSILSSGMSYYPAKGVEDRIIRIIEERAH